MVNNNEWALFRVVEVHWKVSHSLSRLATLIVVNVNEEVSSRGGSCINYNITV